MNRSARVLLLCVSAVALSLQPVRAEKFDYSDPPSGVFSDEWMVVELAEAGKVGYMHVEMSRDGDLVHTTSLTSFSLARVGAPVQIKALQRATETLGGKPVSFDHQLDFSAMSMAFAGEIRDGKVKVVSTQYGQSMTQEHDFPEDAVMMWGSVLASHRHGLEPGTKYMIQTYEPMTAVNSAIEVHVLIEKKETIDLDGKTVEALRTTQSMKLPMMPGGVESVTWVDAEGEVLRSTVQMAGMNMVMTRSTKEKALAEFEPPEFFNPTTIAADRSIDRNAAKTIEFVVRPKNPGMKLPELPKTGMQTPRPNDDGSVAVTVTRQDHEALRKVESTPTADVDAAYLSANPFINIDDPAIVAMAKEARGDAKLPYAIADALRVYVTREIKAKNLDVGLATASEVCRNKEGDCSEHAVLLAALGRANGLPARVVTGIVYVPVFGGSEDIFGFHMWTQFLIGDTWVDFDAAQRESDCNPTHIAFSVDALDTGSLGQIAFPLVNVIGNLDLKIVRVEPDATPATTQPAEG